MVKLDVFKPGTQVLYIPRHAHGDLNHPDVEAGFVTSAHKVNQVAYVCCRFWANDGSNRLRTLSCSECCNPNNLYIKDTRPQRRVDDWIAHLYGDGHAQ
jgi:hypothetical protein